MPVYKERRLPLCSGYPSKRVKVSSGLQANFSSRVTLSPGSTLLALLTCFVMRDILCNGPRFEIILKFTKKQKFKFTKKLREIFIKVDRK